jgi:hypothetical protein
VPDRQRRWARRVLRWAFAAYVLVVTAAALTPIREAWDEILGPNEAQLIIVTDVPIRNVSVTYDGQPIEERPRWVTRDVQDYAAYPNMRVNVFEPILEVSWEGPGGPRSISRVMRHFDWGRRCLFVLKLDAAGEPIVPERPDGRSPFWWNCHQF